MKNESHAANISSAGDGNTDLPLFDPERYELHKRTIAFLMGRYALRHLLFLYEEFEGDLLLPIVLGEIAHHNVRNLYIQEGPCLKPRSDVPAGPERLQHQDSTNAFSISEATGIPRETVRRKIDKMIGKGWLTKGARGEIRLTDAAADNFIDDLNKKTLTELLVTSGCITELLQAE